MTTMRSVSLLVSILVLADAIGAQSDPQPAQPDSRARLRALHKEYMATLTAWQIEARTAEKAATEAQDAGQPAPEAPPPPDLLPLVGKFEAAAADYATTDDAVPFLLWVMTVGSGSAPDAGKRGAETLAEHHADHPDLDSLGPLLPQLRFRVGAGIAGKLLAAIREKNDDSDLLGWVTLADHAHAIDEASIDSEEFAAAKEALLVLAKGARGQLRREITVKIEMREKFGKGQVAPDIVGVDLDGTEFKLSDYRGKVVFLDFWGDW